MKYLGSKKPKQVFLYFQTQRKLFYEIFPFKALVLKLSSLSNILMLEGLSSNSVLRNIAVPQTEASAVKCVIKFGYALVAG